MLWSMYATERFRLDPTRAERLELKIRHCARRILRKRLIYGNNDRRARCKLARNQMAFE